MTSPAEIPLTFGVEFEFMFAIRKSLSKRHHWLQIDRDTQPDPQDNYYGKTVYSEKENTALARILRLGGHGVRLHATEARVGTFTHWTIQNELSLRFADQNREKLTGWLPNRATKKNKKDWLIKGVELVSRVLAAPPPDKGWRTHASIREVEEYIKCVNGKKGDPFGAYVTGECGLHVHVGVDPNIAQDQLANLLPLKTLKYLAYILFQYEGVISGFHLPSRQGHFGTVTASVVGTNLMGLRGSGHICDSMPRPLLEAVQERIFGEGMTIRELAMLMGRTSERTPGGGRRKFVNWAYLGTNDDFKSRPKTLEFRQHAGSLDGEDIIQWINFVLRLIRDAQRKAEPPLGTTASSEDEGIPESEAKM